MEDAINPAAQNSLAKMTVAVGVTSERHHHTNCTETIHVLDGHIKQRIGEEWRDMTTGDTCLIPMNTSHQTRNIGASPAVMIIAYSADTRVYVKD